MNEWHKVGFSKCVLFCIMHLHRVLVLFFLVLESDVYVVFSLF